MLIEALLTQLQRSPTATRSLLELFRSRGPIVKLGSTLIVTGAAQVQEVLARSQDFIAAPVYAGVIKIEGGPSVLGMDPSPAYHQERNAWLRVIGRPALDRFDRIVREEFSRASLALRDGTVDLLNDLIEPALVRAFGRWYGVDVEAARSDSLSVPPGVPTLAHWLRKVGGLIALGSPAPFGFEPVAVRLGGELSRFLQQEAERQGADLAARRGVIGDLLALNDPLMAQPKHVARSVGVMMLAGTTTVKATLLALHELLLRSARAPDAARLTDLARISEANLFAHAIEALRFRPVFPLLNRYCPCPTTLATGTRHATAVAAGTSLIASPLAAMFDPALVDRPDEFLPGRPPEVYLHFGHETQHPCLGRHIAARALQVALAQVLQHHRFEAPGAPSYDGISVASYAVTHHRRGADHVRTVPDHLGSAAARRQLARAHGPGPDERGAPPAP